MTSYSIEPCSGDLRFSTEETKPRFIWGSAQKTSCQLRFIENGLARKVKRMKEEEGEMYSHAAEQFRVEDVVARSVECDDGVP